jgi:hypothetical protein
MADPAKHVMATTYLTGLWSRIAPWGHIDPHDIQPPFYTATEPQGSLRGELYRSNHVQSHKIYASRGVLGHDAV